MTHVNEFGGGQYVNAADLQGRPAVVTIESFSIGEFPKKNKAGEEYMKKQPVLKFVGKTKRLVCNATNREALSFLLGPILEDWVGKKIVLFPDKTQFGAGIVDCVRVRPVDNAQAVGNGGGMKQLPAHQVVQKAGYQTMTRVTPKSEPMIDQSIDPDDGLDEIPF